jgi:hypothetical protein
VAGSALLMPLGSVVNSQQIDVAFLWLLTFDDYANATQLRAVNNLEDVTSNGQLFTAFPFELTLPPDDGQRPQSLKLSFPNVGRELMDLVRKYDAGNTPKVRVDLVLSSSPDTIEKTIDFMVVSNVTFNAMSITFELSPSSIFARRTSVGTYNQAEFPGLFFALNAAGKIGSIPAGTNPELDPPSGGEHPGGNLPSNMNFIDVWGRDIGIDKVLYGNRLVKSETTTISIKITIPALTASYSLRVTSVSDFNGPYVANLSTNIGMGLFGVLDGPNYIGLGRAAYYVFPISATPTVVYFNMQQALNRKFDGELQVHFRAI